MCNVKCYFIKIILHTSVAMLLLSMDIYNIRDNTDVILKYILKCSGNVYHKVTNRTVPSKESPPKTYRLIVSFHLPF